MIIYQKTIVKKMTNQILEVNYAKTKNANIQSLKKKKKKSNNKKIFNIIYRSFYLVECIKCKQVN